MKNVKDCNQCNKFDLSVVELSNKKVALQYAEYFKNGNDPWMIKTAFNKRLDYSLSDKVLRFKGYEFEILSVENGRLHYKRIK